MSEEDMDIDEDQVVSVEEAVEGSAFIKRISIKGFKSYSELDSAATAGEFSPALNLICGRNGSGKSNLFAATSNSSLSRDQRQMLLHEGPGDQVLSAYVEIVFDNSGHRFSIDKEEVAIRRTIGLKKDEFFLNRKHTTKQEITNLLESAGLSRSNPYYIVQQGKIYELAMMTDEARLLLLKEVAGTRVYDERRSESIKTLAEAETKKAQLEGMLSSLEERLEELEGEREELLEFQRLDRTRRSLQYAIYEKDRERAAAKISQIEGERAALLSAEDEEAPAAEGQQIRELQKRIKTLEAEAEHKRQERDTLRDEHSQLLTRQTQLQLERNERFSQLSSDQKSDAERARELKQVKGQVNKSEKMLAKQEKSLNTSQEQERELSASLQSKELRLSELYAREARAAQFRTKKERDAWLRSEVARITEGPLAIQQTNVNALSATIEESSRRADHLKNSLEEQRQRYASAEKVLRSAGQDMNKLRQKRDAAAVERKELWRREEELRQEDVQCTQEVARALRSLHQTTSREVARGLESMRQVVEQHEIEGVYGPLVELFTLRSEDFSTAVEITGGGSLFHVVVDTDEVATSVLREMNRAKLPGRVTFVPLNKLRARQPADYPDSNQALSMLNDCIDFKEHLRPAMELVFGRTIVCPDLSTASTFAQTHNFDSITLDGDRVDRKGAMTGGYQDRRSSRLAAAAALTHAHRRSLELKEENMRVKAQFRGMDDRVNDFVSQMQRKEEELREAQRTIEAATRDVRSLTAEEQRVRLDVSALRARILDYQHVLRGLEGQRDALQSELGSAFSRELSEVEQGEVSELSQQVEQIKTELADRAAERAALAQECANVRELLAGNLRRRLAELETSMVSVSVNTLDTQVSDMDTELQELADRLQELDERAEQAEQASEERRAQVSELADKMEELRKTHSGSSVEAMERRKKMDELLNNRALFLREMDQATRKIREVGTISAQEFEEYKEKAAKELYVLLSETQHELQAYSNVNKKAGEQFMSFLDQKDELRKRKDELDGSLEAIRDLLAVLDERKNEAILRTFKGVAKHFAEVFKEIVPEGSAHLSMVKNSQASGGKRKKAGDVADAVDAFIGVRISCTFGGVMGAPRDTAQLSGGQLSVVALAFIFGVQRTDPAPFYLFDEIDKAMDPAYRAAVARVIVEGSSSAQYIVISHRPELIQLADNLYRTVFRNKKSSLTAINVDEALGVVNAEQAAAAAASDD